MARTTTAVAELSEVRCSHRGRSSSTSERYVRLLLWASVRAVAFESAGGPEVLRLRELPDPVPGPGEVLIRVAYAGLNYAEVMRRRGDFGAPHGPTVPGLEVSGHVAALGDGVDGLVLGDPVTAFTDTGGYAELAVARAALVQPLRTAAGEVDLRTGGGFSCVVPTSYGLLADAARLRSGESVLVHAAAGGVGSVAGQVARALGAGLVLGTVGSEAKRDYALRFGYDEVWLREGFVERARSATSGRGIDVVLDSIGGATREQGLDALAPLGRLVVVGNASGSGDVPVSSDRLWRG